MQIKHCFKVTSPTCLLRHVCVVRRALPATLRTVATKYELHPAITKKQILQLSWVLKYAIDPRM